MFSDLKTLKLMNENPLLTHSGPYIQLFRFVPEVNIYRKLPA